MSTHDTTPTTTTTIPTYISRTRLMEITGLSDTTIWRCVHRGELPPPTRLTPGRVAWPQPVIEQWLAERAGVDGTPRARPARRRR